jgi:5'-nucleotidase
MPSNLVQQPGGQGADVVSVEQIESSARFGQDRDAEVDALNAGAGAGSWDYVRRSTVVPCAAPPVESS